MYYVQKPILYHKKYLKIKVVLTYTVLIFPAKHYKNRKCIEKINVLD